jgi:hypothetical protein
MDVEVPPTLLQEIDALVAAGAFATRDAAVAELLRLGLDAMRGARPRRPPFPPRPPVPPGVRDPHEDEPISVDPSDVNWAE